MDSLHILTSETQNCQDLLGEKDNTNVVSAPEADIVDVLLHINLPSNDNHWEPRVLYTFATNKAHFNLNFQDRFFQKPLGLKKYLT